MPFRLLTALWLFLLAACTHTAPTRDQPDDPIGGDEEASVWAKEPLDAARTERLREALVEAKTFAEALRPRYAATMLANAERGRVLRPLVDGLNLVQQSNVENAPLVLIQPFEKYAVADAWKRSCARGVKAIADIVVLPPEERASVLYATCKLDKSGLVTKEEAKTADASALAIATLIHDRLKSGGVLGAEETEALRMLVIGSLEAFHDIVPVADPNQTDGGIEASGDGGVAPIPATTQVPEGSSKPPAKPGTSAAPIAPSATSAPRSTAPPAAKPAPPTPKPGPTPKPALSTSRAP